MQITQINVDHQNQEMTQHGSIRFPMQVYLDDLQKYDLGYILWHWHKEVEFAVVLEGEVELRANDTSLILRTGEGIFINSEVLHSMKTYNTHNAVLFTIVVNPQLLSNYEHGLIYEKYIYPLITCKAISFIQLREQPWQKECLQLLTRIYHLDQQKTFGYELLTINYLMNIWYLLIVDSQDAISRNDSNKLTINQQRIKNMMKYINTHYQESLQLSDIASVVSISKSECNRCFQSMLGMTPFEYLIQVRLENAITLLIETNMPLSEIAASCGFNNLSYFGKLFKQYKGISPKKFRDSKK